MAEDLQRSIASNAPELKFRLGKAGWNLVRIPPGEFVMGSPLSEAGREDWEVPARRVRVSKPFYLGRYEITQAQYQTVVHGEPNEFSDPNLPADHVTYREALEFCRRLSRVLRIAVTLPTEAQWEYACRAGTTTPYYSGSTEADLDRVAWYAGNSNEQTHPVGRKQPNAFGLYDMLGNVSEPCIDYILSFDKLDSVDPEGSDSPDYGAVRGGSFMESAARCRASYRVRTRDNLAGIGIRIAVNP